MIFGPDATDEEIKTSLERHKKRIDNLSDYFTIAFSSSSENRFEEAEKAVYGDSENK